MTDTARRTPGERPRSRRRIRIAVASTAAAATAVLAATGLGLGPSVAQADPGDTVLPLGSSQLVQSEDLAAIQVKLDTESVLLNRNEDFSSCLGEGNRWTDVLAGSPKPFTAAWTSRRHPNQGLSESVAQAKSAEQAQSYARTLVKVGIRRCQGTSSPWDFHYGPTTSSAVGSGVATWALSYRGTSTRPTGGVVVFSKGTDFGIVSLEGSWGPAAQTLESVAKVTVSRLDG